MPNKPVTEVLLKHKETQSIEAFASTLEKIAQKLRTEGQFTFTQGEKHTDIHPAEQLKVAYEYTKKGDKHSFEIEFDWYEGAKALGTMSIE